MDILTYINLYLLVVMPHHCFKMSLRDISGENLVELAVDQGADGFGSSEAIEHRISHIRQTLSHYSP